MLSFKAYLKEGIENDVVEKASKKVHVFAGRFQPLHQGHLNIINSMKNPVVAIVKGKASSADRARNPLPEKYQIELIKKAAPKAKVMVVSTGYIPELANELRKQGMEMEAFYAGADRISSYTRQFNSINAKLPDEKRFDVKMKETPRFTSATIVRNTIKDGDLEAFKPLMPKSLHGEWDKLRKFIK